MWAWKDYFSPHFLSLLFSLLNQIRENVIFHLIFLFLFSILPVFTPTKHTLKLDYFESLSYSLGSLWGPNLSVRDLQVGATPTLHPRRLAPPLFCRLAEPSIATPLRRLSIDISKTSYPISGEFLHQFLNSSLCKTFFFF